MKCYNQFIITSLLLLLSLSGKAQETFEMMYHSVDEVDSSFHYEPNTIWLDSDGAYVFSGSKNATLPSFTSFISKVTADGEPLWSKSIIGMNARQIIPTSDGGFLMAGSSSDNAYNKKFILIKTDASCDTLWTDQIYHSNATAQTYYKFSKTIELENGSFVTLGSANSIDNNFDIKLINTDAQGNNLWSKSIGGSGMDDAFDLKQCSDNGFIICGITHSDGLDGGNICLIKTDSIGNAVWAKSYSNDYLMVPKNVFITNDGGYYVLGYYEASESENDVFAFKTDSNGGIVWANSYGTSNSEMLFGAMQLLDGSVLATGGVDDALSQERHAFLMKLSMAGDTIWSKVYGAGAENVGHSICPSGTGGFVVAASIKTNSESDLSYPLLVKTDSQGNTACSNDANFEVETMSYFPVQLNLTTENDGEFGHFTSFDVLDINQTDSLLCPYTQGINSFNDDDLLTAFPNPFHETCLIRLESTTSESCNAYVFNSTGKLVRQFEVSNVSEFLLERDDLSEGLYLLRIQDNERIVGQLKIVVR